VSSLDMNRELQITSRYYLDLQLFVIELNKRAD
jgi:hypothetical protein